MINQDLLNEQIIRAKKRTASLVHHKNKEMIGGLTKLNKEICLVIADFKCEKCKKETELTLHHLIPRKAKDFTDFWRYASQRCYFANSIILCKKCHMDYHCFNKHKDDDMLVISNYKIEEIKKKYNQTIVW